MRSENPKNGSARAVQPKSLGRNGGPGPVPRGRRLSCLSALGSWDVGGQGKRPEHDSQIKVQLL